MDQITSVTLTNMKNMETNSKMFMDILADDLKKRGCSIISIDYVNRRIEYSQPVPVQKIKFQIKVDKDGLCN